MFFRLVHLLKISLAWEIKVFPAATLVEYLQQLLAREQRARERKCNGKANASLRTLYPSSRCFYQPSELLRYFNSFARNIFKWDFLLDFHTLCFSLNETDGKKSIWIAVIVVWHTRHSSFYCWKKRSVLLSSTYRFTTKGSDCKALAMNFKNHQWLQRGTFSLSPSSAINDFLDFPTNP